MTKTGRAVLFTMLLVAVVLMVAVSAGPSLAGKKEGGDSLRISCHMSIPGAVEQTEKDDYILLSLRWD